MEQITIPKHLAERLIGVCNELLEAWPDPGDAVNEKEAEEFNANLTQITIIRDELAAHGNLHKNLALP